MELTGKTAYDAWRETQSGHGPDGHPLPEWEDLPEQARNDWAVVEDRVKRTFGATY